MDEPAAQLGDLQDRAVRVRLSAIDANRARIAELEAIWRELSELVDGFEDARPLSEEVSADISRFKKLDIALDTEWLADAKRARRQAGAL